MRNDTHTEIIYGENDGQKIHVILTGVPDECKHDDDGESVYFNDEAKYWEDSELPSDTEKRCEFMKENNINGGCVSCSKCGKPFTPDINNMP